MAYNDLTFFTNEPERDLYSRFNIILQNNTQFFDILVGYFRTSGFFKLYPAMQDIYKIRVLVGLNVDDKTLEIINQSHKEAKDAFGQEIENEFNQSDDTHNVEQGVRAFIEWLRLGKIEMKIYPNAPIHAKVYIMRKDLEKNPEHFGSVITGSSNFSFAGLVNNLEFNVELKDSRDVKFALEKFEELWEKEYALFNKTSNHKFRNYKDVVQYVFRYWQLAKGDFYPVNGEKRGRNFSVHEHREELLNAVRNQAYPMICTNDDSKCNFDETKKELISVFDSILPNKSEFETQVNV